MVKEKIAICGKKITLREVHRASSQNVELILDPTVLEKAGESRRLLEQLESQGASIYGITTGFGAQGNLHIPPAWRIALQSGVIEYHGAGVGPVLTRGQSRAVFLTRIISLARGHSGIRPGLLEHMVDVFNHGIAPVIPSRGSVGASGDLTPLSYLAAMLAGGREVWYEGARRLTREAFQELKIQPWKWDIKEGLALINGTAVMTALAAVSVVECGLLAQWSDEITALSAAALGTPREPFEPWIHQQKHHPGSILSAQHIVSRGDLDPRPISDPLREEHQLGQNHGTEKPGEQSYENTENLADQSMQLRRANIQPRYSLRCAPQMNGVLRDTLAAVGVWVENELNSANDNPLFDQDQGRVYHTGNFFGGHISAACDYLRIALSTTVSLIDRQVQQLLDSGGILPNNLVPPGKAGSPGGEMGVNDPAGGSEGPQFALKALGITISALAAEVQHTAGPVSVLTRPTESQNQDVVSMGTISALKLDQSLELAFLAAAHGLAAAGQALEIRRAGTWGGRGTGSVAPEAGEGGNPSPQHLIDWLRHRFPFVRTNQELGFLLDRLAEQMRATDSREI